MERKRVREVEVKRYLALHRIKEDACAEISILEKGFLDIIPADGFRFVGPYQVCHKTTQRKAIKWKEECIKEIGEEATAIIAAEASLGAISHGIKVNVRRDMIDINTLRVMGRVPEHIPDEQVGDYLIMKKVEVKP